MDAIVAKALNAYIAAPSIDSSSNPSDDHILHSSTVDDKSFEKAPYKENKSCLIEATPHKRLPLKKQLVLQWKDQEIAVTEYNETVMESKFNDYEVAKSMEAGTSYLTPTEKSSTPKNQQASPLWCKISLMEYEDQLKKLERCVCSACEYELKLLNEAKSVREKRNRMVYRLKYMKLKVLRRAHLSSVALKNGLLPDCNFIDGSPREECPTFADDLPLPPVFCQTPISIRRQR
jgi:hypothetical protein